MKRYPRSEVEILRDLVKSLGKLLICYSVGSAEGGTHVDRIRALRMELAVLDMTVELSKAPPK